MVDILYPVRPGEKNPELRYSLRSLVNLPHDRVWIVGYMPTWVTGVEFIPGGNQASGSYLARVYENIMVACQHPEVAEDVVVFNDDFYVTAPVDSVPIRYRGSLGFHLSLVKQAGEWKSSLSLTQQLLKQEGHISPISYELHQPMPVRKSDMAAVLEKYRHTAPECPPQWRSLYGNVMAIRGEQQVQDVKGGHLRPRISTPFHSTSDVVYPHYRIALRNLFPRRSRYEVAPK